MNSILATAVTNSLELPHPNITILGLLSLGGKKRCMSGCKPSW